MRSWQDDFVAGRINAFGQHFQETYLDSPLPFKKDMLRRSATQVSAMHALSVVSRRPLSGLEAQSPKPPHDFEHFC